MTETSTEQMDAMQKAGAIAFRLSHAGDKQAAISIRALLGRVKELEEAQEQRVALHGMGLAAIGKKHFGNPIPQEWYTAARELEAVYGITQEKHG